MCQAAILSVLNEATRAALEATMNVESLRELTPFYREGHKEGRDEGRLEEARSALTRVLRVRWGAVDPHFAERIAQCTDLGTLERWLDEDTSALGSGQAYEVTAEAPEPTVSACR